MLPQMEPIALQSFGQHIHQGPDIAGSVVGGNGQCRSVPTQRLAHAQQSLALSAFHVQLDQIHRGVAKDIIQRAGGDAVGLRAVLGLNGSCLAPTDGEGHLVVAIRQSQRKRMNDRRTFDA